jgi:membrane associated rhomboid family serine protease
MPDFDDSSYDARRESDYQPYRLPNGYPIYLGSLLVVIHVVMLVVWMFIFTSGHAGWMRYVVVTAPTLMHWALWQPFTYALVHPPGNVWDTFNFAFEMYMLWMFGREVERFFGRTNFLKLYLILVLVAPIVVLLCGWLNPPAAVIGPNGVALPPIPYFHFGSFCADFAIFVAFATLYPRAQLLFALTAKWVAVILCAVVTIPDIANHEWTHLLVFGASVATAYVFVRYEKGEITFPSFRFRLPGRKPKFHVVPRPAAPPVQKVKLTQPAAATMDDVDALLDKIARTGLNSLSAAERARLERASADLKKRPEPH